MTENLTFRVPERQPKPPIRTGFAGGHGGTPVRPPENGRTGAVSAG
jgi:hypothetical protein